MVSRVSSFGQQQLLIRSIQENQSRLFENQRQISSGREVDEFRGLGGKTGTVLGSRSFLTRIESFQQTIDTVQGRINANDVQLGGIIGAVESLQENVRTAVANRNAQGFREQLEQTFEFITNALNSNIDGTFQFSGANTDTPPVNVTDLASLAALPNVSDAFDNADIAFEARIADGVDIEFGLLADEVATEAFDTLLGLYNFDTGAGGPIEGELDDAQFAFLQTQIQTLGDTIDNLRQVEVDNGLSFNRLKVVEQQHTDTSIFLETFISDQEDVDLAEAVTELNNNQVALQASFQAVASLSRLSLLNFL
jgi:flagellar hook-associated protein 3 FlgL